jgi:hypothetical protein
MSETTPVEALAGRPGVACRNHVDRASVALCARCADFICGLCAISIDGLVYCPSCLVKVRADAVAFGPYIPWEHRQRLGWFQAAWQTIVASFTRPQEFYRRMPMTGGLSEPLLFAMLMRSIVVVTYGILIVGFYVILAAATRQPMMLFQAGVQAGSTVFGILQAAVLLFVMAGILHVAVLVIAGGLGFERTFRVYSYGRAIDLLELIPIGGFIAGAFYRIYLHYLGLKEAHGLSTNQAAGIAMVPMGLYFAFVIFAVGIAVAAMLLIMQLGP